MVQYPIEVGMALKKRSGLGRGFLLSDNCLQARLDFRYALQQVTPPSTDKTPARGAFESHVHYLLTSGYRVPIIRYGDTEFRKQTRRGPL